MSASVRPMLSSWADRAPELGPWPLAVEDSLVPAGLAHVSATVSSEQLARMRQDAALADRMALPSSSSSSSSRDAVIYRVALLALVGAALVLAFDQ